MPSGRCWRRSTARAARRSPGYAELSGDRLSLKALLLSADGKAERRAEGAGAAADPTALGREVGERLRAGAGPEFGLDQVRRLLRLALDGLALGVGGGVAADTAFNAGLRM